MDLEDIIILTCSLKIVGYVFISISAEILMWLSTAKPFKEDIQFETVHVIRGDDCKIVHDSTRLSSKYYVCIHCLITIVN